MVSICGKIKVDKEKNKNGYPSHGTLIFYGEKFNGNGRYEGNSCGSAWVNDNTIAYEDIRLEKADFVYDREGRVVGINYAK